MNYKKEKILFIIPSLLGGGALKTVCNISGYLKERYDVEVIGLFKTDKTYDFKCKTIVFDNPIEKSPIKKLIRIIKAIRFVKKYKLENNIKYSISFLRYADLVNVLSRTKNKEKTIVSIRNYESIEYKNMPIKKAEEKYCMDKADHIVAISNEVKADLIKNFGIKAENVTTIYNPCMVKPNKEIQNIANQEIFVKNKTIINVASLKMQKGQWHLIRAFSEVVKKIPDASLIILGKGEYEEYLKNLVKDYRLEKNVHFLGFVMNPLDYVINSDIFIFSSIFEGLGNALMEALACQKAIISTDYSCGAREILAPNTNCEKKVTDNIDYAEYGVLIPVCDGNKYTSKDPITKEEKIMAEAILNLIGDEKIRKEYEKKTYNRIKDFDINVIVSEWEKLFENL